jgi:hypothetical protein
MENGHEAFDKVVSELASDFQQNPFHYGNEDILVPELYHRMRNLLDNISLEVEYRRDYGDEDYWRVSDIFDRVERTGQIPRVRPEVAFVKDGERWTFRWEENGETKETYKKFDLVVFDDNPPLIMQSKEEGPGNYMDAENYISVLCEIKHSKNMSSQFYSESAGTRDVIALSRYPGEVGKRVYLFLDWWPEYKRGEERFGTHWQKLKENTHGRLDNPVDVMYVSRHGKVKERSLH